MKNILYKYESDNERVTIRVDYKIIGEFQEVKVDNAALVIKILMEMYQQVFNFKSTINDL